MSIIFAIWTAPAVWRVALVAAIGAASVIAGATPVMAQAVDWIPETASEAPVTVLRYDSAGTIWAGTGCGGAYTSIDSGVSWTLATSAFTEPVTGIAVKPGDDNTVIVATPTDLWRTTNGGTSWSSVLTGGLGIGGTAASLRPVTFHPVSTSDVYAATDDGVWKSTDSGASWSKSSSGVGDLSVTSVIGDSGNSQAAVIGTADGPYVTTNGGAFWSLQTSGLTDPWTVALWESGANGVVLVGGESGIFRSTNGGSTWSAPTTGTTSFVVDFAETSSTALLAASNGGLYRSTDAGDTWTQVDTNPCYSIAASGTAAIAGTRDGRILTSSDFGQTWSVTSATIGAALYHSLTGDPSTGDVYCISWDASAAHRRLWKRSAGGIWTTVTTLPSGVKGSQTVVRTSHASSGESYCVGDDIFGAVIAKSTDSAATWTAMAASDAPSPFTTTDAATSPSTAGMLLISTAALLQSPTHPQLHLYNPATTAWSHVGSALGQSFSDVFVWTVAVRGTTNELWAAGSDAAGGVAYSSSDLGMTWTQCGSGTIPASVTDIQVNGPGGTTIFVGTTGSGVWYSADSGATWSQRGLATSRINELHFDIATGRLYAATNSGVQYSTNSGATWNQLGIALTGISVKSVVSEGGNVYAAAGGMGVMRIVAP